MSRVNKSEACHHSTVQNSSHYKSSKMFQRNKTTQSDQSTGKSPKNAAQRPGFTPKEISDILKQALREETASLLSEFAALKEEITAAKSTISSLRHEVLQLKLTSFELLELVAALVIKQIEHPSDNNGDTGGLNFENKTPQRSFEKLDWLRSNSVSLDTIISEEDLSVPLINSDSFKFLKSIFSDKDIKPENCKELIPKNKLDGIVATRSGSYFLSDHSDVFAAPKRVFMYLQATKTQAKNYNKKLNNNGAKTPMKSKSEHKIDAQESTMNIISNDGK